MRARHQHRRPPQSHYPRASRAVRIRRKAFRPEYRPLSVNFAAVVTSGGGGEHHRKEHDAAASQ